MLTTTVEAIEHKNNCADANPMDVIIGRLNEFTLFTSELKIFNASLNDRLKKMDKNMEDVLSENVALNIKIKQLATKVDKLALQNTELKYALGKMSLEKKELQDKFEACTDDNKKLLDLYKTINPELLIILEDWALNNPDDVENIRRQYFKNRHSSGKTAKPKKGWKIWTVIGGGGIAAAAIIVLLILLL